MKKRINYIFAILFTAICIIPLCFINKAEGKISEVENRTLASFPKTFDEAGKYNHNAKIEFNSWLNDNIGFRDTMMKLNTQFEYQLFHKINSSNVILGKKGWLFYQGENNIAVKDYQAQELYTEEQLENILYNVKLLKTWCDENNMEFVLMLIPNKEHIYGEYMPNGIYETNKKKNIDLVVDYIRNHSDIKVAYPKEQLLKKKERKNVYYKYDTHWNDIGAYEGYKSLMDELHMEPILFDDVYTVTTKSGDLSNMAMINDFIAPYEESAIAYSGEIETLYDDNNGNNAYQKYHCKTGSRKIFFMGDSFRSALKPMLSRTFEYSDFVHRGTGIFDEVLKEKPDVFVYQLVERYLPALQNRII